MVFILGKTVTVAQKFFFFLLFSHTLVEALYVSVDGTRSNGFIFVFLKFYLKCSFKHTYAFLCVVCLFIIRFSVSVRYFFLHLDIVFCSPQPVDRVPLSK